MGDSYSDYRETQNRKPGHRVNVLYISYDGLTDPLGQSQVLPYLEGIAAAGHRIVLMSFEKPDRYVSLRDVIEQRCLDANIDWQPLMYTKKPPVLSTLWDVMRMQRRVKQLYRKYHFEIVHCRSYIAALAGVMLKKKFGVRFVFDMRGFWADERVDGGLWRLKNPLYKSIYKYFKRKEVEFLQTADYTISLTQNAADEIHSWKNISHQPVPIEVIPCCADMDLFNRNNVDDKQVQQLRTELGIPSDAFVLTYIGSLGTWYMLD